MDGRKRQRVDAVLFETVKIFSNAHFHIFPGTCGRGLIQNEDRIFTLGSTNVQDNIVANKHS